MQGWVSIHRKIMNNPVWQDPQLLKLWMLCLLEASHKEHEQLVGKQIVKLQPGEFVTGRFALAKSYNEGAKKRDIVPESTLWRWLKWLEQNQFVNIKSNTKYSVVTIVNWNQYQQNEQQMNNGNQGFQRNGHQSGQQDEQQVNGLTPYIPAHSGGRLLENEQQMNSKWTTNGQQMNTNNNGNNVNNDNNLSSSSISDSEFAKVFSFYQQNLQMGVSESPYNMQLISDWFDEFGSDLLLAAMKVSAKQEKRGTAFLEGVLKNWREAGVKSIEDARLYEIQFKQNGKRKMKVINGGKQSEIRQSSYEQDYSQYDFTKQGNVSWLSDGD